MVVIFLKQIPFPLVKIGKHVSYLSISTPISSPVNLPEAVCCSVHYYVGDNIVCVVFHKLESQHKHKIQDQYSIFPSPQVPSAGEEDFGLPEITRTTSLLPKVCQYKGIVLYTYFTIATITLQHVRICMWKPQCCCHCNKNNAHTVPTFTNEKKKSVISHQCDQNAFHQLFFL